jgi:hypothetical protein
MRGRTSPGGDYTCSAPSEETVSITTQAFDGQIVDLDRAELELLHPGAQNVEAPDGQRPDRQRANRKGAERQRADRR